MTKPSRTVVIGLSGASSSGKTTLSRILKEILPNSCILHEDDFYKPDSEIPYNQAKGEQDWDTPGAIDFPKLLLTIREVKRNGCSGEDRNRMMNQEEDSFKLTQSFSPSEIVDIKQQTKQMVNSVKQQVGGDVCFCIVDGFLLYHDQEVMDTLDVKLLLHAPYSVLKDRRENRAGYKTTEGYWTDPPGYFDKMVWPAYVDNHKHLFTHVGLGAEDDKYRFLNQHATDVLQIRGFENHNRPLSSLVKWALSTIGEQLVGNRVDR